MNRGSHTHVAGVVSAVSLALVSTRVTPARATTPPTFTVNSVFDVPADLTNDPNFDICRTNVGHSTCTLRAAVTEGGDWVGTVGGAHDRSGRHDHPRQQYLQRRLRRRSVADAELGGGLCRRLRGVGQVTVNDLINLVNIALGNAAPSACANGTPAGATIDVALLVRAVSNALSGCH